MSKKKKQKKPHNTAKKKHEDLQPWLDEFNMFDAYQQAGYLQMVVNRHEAFVTNAALHSMSDGNDPMLQAQDGSLEKTAKRLRTYAGWLSQEGESYLNDNFAVNVVAHDEPHDPLYTILLSKHRKLWKMVDKVEWITYKDKEKKAE